MKQVLIPPASGAASALGFLAAPLSFEQVRSHPVRLEAPDAAATIDAILRELTEAARTRLPADEEVVTERLADMRLEGQMHEISVALPDGAIIDATMPAILERFAIAYAARYTSVYAGVGVMAVSFRVRCRAPLPRLSLTEAGGRSTGAAQKGRAWPGSMAASSIRRSTIVMPWHLARASPVRRSSRNARRPPSSRPATTLPSMPPERWRSTSALPLLPPRASPPTRRSNRPPR